jgi:hypothetical protein
MNAITVCVDMDDILAVTLPHNAKHFGTYTVVTAPHDTATMAAVPAFMSVFITDAFYRDGAKFNKGLAIEEALPHKGWIATIDADIILPDPFLFDLDALDKNCLYGARRRMLFNPADYHGQTDWSGLPLAPDGEIPGCFQLFHADAAVLRERPWFGTDWTHAGGYDSVFEAKFRPHNTRWLPFEILHLGQDGVNWYGRVTDRLDGKPTPNQTQHVHDMRRMRHTRAVTGSLASERL